MSAAVRRLEFDQSASSGAPRSVAAALVPGVALAAAVLLVYFS